ncbi:MAG: allophanate hydrolase subunit 1 [Hydrogenophilus sp.]|nr:allophanate hydrolase subunit 1 [Hydrogenophilus sp.]
MCNSANPIAVPNCTPSRSSPSLMESEYPRLRPLGDAAWLLQLGEALDPALIGRVRALTEQIQHLSAQRIPPWDHLQAVVPALSSLACCYDPLRTDPDLLAAHLLALARAPLPQPSSSAPARTWRLPISFHPNHAPDLAAAATALHCTPPQLCDTLLATPLEVYFLGFLPGFPYMGPLPPSLHLPRRSTPRLRVPSRSVAIAGPLCAIYPCQTPGGWHLIGRTPLPLWFPHRRPPALLAPGDRVIWAPLSVREYRALRAQLLDGRLDPFAYCDGPLPPTHPAPSDRRS